MLKLVLEPVQNSWPVGKQFTERKRATIVIKSFAYFACCTEFFYLAIRILRLPSLKSIPK